MKEPKSTEYEYLVEATNKMQDLLQRAEARPEEEQVHLTEAAIVAREALVQLSKDVQAQKYIAR